MRRVVKVLLRGLVVVLPIAVTVYILWWLGSAAESLIGSCVPERYYFPGIGILAGLILVFTVGVLMSFWIFQALFHWGERQLNKVPLVKTLYSSVKDLTGFFPGGGRGSGLRKVVIAKVAGLRMVGMLTRETFDDLPEALHGRDEVLVYFPMSYQLGGFTVWVPRSAVQPVELTVGEGMRFAMTGGMTTEAANPLPPKSAGDGDADSRAKPSPHSDHPHPVR